MIPRTNIQALLGLEHPIVQGPFGGGVSTVRLVAEVSNRGGLGSFGAFALEPEAIVRLAADIRAATSRPFALNLWVSDHDEGGLAMDEAAFERWMPLFAPLFDEFGLARPTPPVTFHPGFERQVEALLAARPPAFSFVFGIPSAKVLEECRRLGIVTIGAATTLEEAAALAAARVDLIVATGFEAAGHRPSFLKSAEASLMGTLALTRVAASRSEVPVIAAGGIIDRAGIDAVLGLGAGAAQLGTAFLACDESGATPEHRAALFGPGATDTVLTRAYSGRLARGMRNRLIEEMERRAGLPPFPIQSWFVGHLKAAAAKAGDPAFGSLYASQAAPNLRHRTVADLMDALIAG